MISSSTGPAAQEFLLIVNAAKIDEDFTWLQEPHAQPALNRMLELVNLQRRLCGAGHSRTPVRRRFSRRCSLSHGRQRRNRIAEFDSATSAQRRTSERPDAGRASFVATTGYTGELGFEVARSR